MSEKRVFITGLGALTACGHTLDLTWQALSTGTTGISEIKNWDITSWPCRLGAEIKDFQPARFLPDRKLAKVISKQDVLGIYAATQAVEDSGIIDYRTQLSAAEAFNDQTAVFVGSPGNKYFQQYDFLSLVAKTQGDMRAFAEQLFAEVHPMWLLRILPNNVLAYTGITYGFKGLNQNITNHGVSGAQAIIEAYHAIKMGLAERAVVVAYDSATEPQALFYYNQLGVLSPTGLTPYDKNHNGTVLAEGAGAIVLESEDSVNARQAKCYAEVIGGGSASEASGLLSLEEDGGHLSSLIRRVCETYHLSADDFGFVIGHGNGNEKSDVSEAKAIAETLGAQVPVSGFKWATGHTICASGVIDAALMAYALDQQYLPGIANLSQVSERCGINALNEPCLLSTRPKHALMINRGFASMNAALILKAI